MEMIFVFILLDFFFIHFWFIFVVIITTIIIVMVIVNVYMFVIVMHGVIIGWFRSMGNLASLPWGSQGRHDRMTNEHLHGLHIHVAYSRTP